MQLLALLVLAATAATSNGLAAPVANPGATTSQGGLFAAVAAKNAEMLAVKEGEHRRIKANLSRRYHCFAHRQAAHKRRQEPARRAL